MSIIRLSVLKNTIYAPDNYGNLAMSPYNKRKLLGAMEEFKRPDLPKKSGNFYHYMFNQVRKNATDLRDDKPIIIMVHGFLFDPKQAVSTDPKDTDNPHGRIFHFKVKDMKEEIRHHTSSMPLGLGFKEHDETGREGLAIAFGWQSQPGFASSLINHFKNFYARAYENAEKSAWALVNTIHTLTELLPGKKIDLVCHSLGSRVVVRGLAMLCEYFPEITKLVDRVIILGGAEYVVEASIMMDRLMQIGDNNMPSFYNIVSRENDVLDKLGENFGPRTFGNTNVIGHNGLDVENPGKNWLDLQIDDAKLQKWMMEQRNIEVSGDRPGNIWDHWYYYTFRPNMNLYNQILRDRSNWIIKDLRSNSIPDKVSKRWSIFGD